MFDFVRKHTRIMQFLLFLLIFPSFVLFGLDGYRRFQEKGPAVARVAGVDVSQSEWDAAHKGEVERLRNSMPSLDPKLLDSPEARYATLERLLRDRVLAAAATDAHLTASDARVARELQENPAISALRGPDGRLDMARYRQLVGAQGMTPEMFEAQVRTDLSTRQVLQGVLGTGLLVPSQAQVSINAFLERREIQVARFATTDYAARQTVSDAEVEAYYKRHESRFQAPEQADIEYLILDLEALKRSVVLNEEELKTYFEQNAARLAGQEERRASHILINAPKNMATAERQSARTRAEELLALVRKAPETFADLARKHSQDTGSAAKGGDLDFFARGAMVKPFEEAVFGLKKGEISGLVESEFGYHIIRLTDIKAPKVKTYAEMKPEIEAQLRKQQAQRKFAETAEAFTNGVYEQADSLKPVAERLKLDLQTASGLTRTPAPGATGPLANPKFLVALFAADAVDKKRNTEAVETGANQLVSGRIVKYTPARTRPFVEVRDQAKAALLAERGAEAARKDGMGRLEAWRAKPDAATLPASVVIARDQPGEFPSAVVEAALRADMAKAPVFVGVELGDQGYAVVRVNKVAERPVAGPDAARQDAQQYAQLWTSAEAMAYYDFLKARYKAQILVQKPAPGSTSPVGPDPKS